MRGEDETELTDRRISHDASVKYLLGRTFGKELEGIVKRSEDFEQGLKVVFLSKTGKYRIINMEDISPGEVGGGFVEPEDTSVFEVHTHPIVVGNSLHTVPSDVDLEPSFGNEGPFAKMVIVMGDTLRAWVWEVPKRASPTKTARSWRQGLNRINDPSYLEVDELFDRLENGGLKIGRGDLESDRLAESLVDLIESTGIRLG